MYKKSLDESTKERKVTVPQMKDIDGWLAFCLGVKEADEVVASTEVGAEKWRDQLLPVSTEVDDKEKAIRKRKRELAKTLGIAVELKCEEEEGEVIEDGESVEVEPEERIAVEDRKDVSSDVEGDADSDVDDAPQYHSWDGSHSVNPALSLILQFDQVLTQKLLAILIDYLDAEDEVSGATPSLSPLCGQWLYSLLARVEKPLHRDVVASIRQLYRRCCVLRNQLPLKHQDTASEDFQLDLAALNTLISISGYYFGQGEYYSSFEPIIEASYNDNTSDPSQRNLLLEGSSDEEEDGWEEEDTNAMEEDEAGEVEELEESAPKRRAF